MLLSVLQVMMSLFDAALSPAGHDDNRSTQSYRCLEALRLIRTNGEHRLCLEVLRLIRTNGEHRLCFEVLRLIRTDSEYTAVCVLKPCYA